MTSQLERKLKLKRLRMTSARKAIFNILTSSERALSAREICEKTSEMTDLQADSASVYRNLSLFTEIGLVHRFQSGKYSVCKHEDKHSHDHMHIVATCSSCGKTREVTSHDEKICQLARSFKGYIEGFSSFSGITMLGNCKSCS